MHLIVVLQSLNAFGMLQRAYMILDNCFWLFRLFRSNTCLSPSLIRMFFRYKATVKCVIRPLTIKLCLTFEMEMKQIPFVRENNFSFIQQKVPNLFQQRSN